MNCRPLPLTVLLSLFFSIIVLNMVTTASAGTPTVSSITPSSGLNTTSISITDITGTGFASGASLLLTPVNLTPAYKGRIADGSGGTPYLDQPQSVYVSGNYAYVASYNSNALEIVNVTDKAHPVHAGSLIDGSGGTTYLNQPHSVYVSGNYAYVASEGSSALEIVNVTDPAHPSHAGSIVDGDDGGLVALSAADSVYVSGNYAYVASTGSNALEIVNITDPASPTHKGKITNGDGGAALSAAYSVFVSGNYAYVASQGSNALEIVNVTDPANPTHAGKITNGGIVALDAPNSVYVSGNYAYVSSESSNALEIVNVTDPANPTHAGKITNGASHQAPFVEQPLSVYVSGNYAYVASYGSFCIEVVDVTDPANPVHKGGFWGSDTASHPLSIYVSENYAYYGSWIHSNALEITDIGAITGTGVTTDSATHIHGTINPVGKAAGKYNVVVTNPAGGFGVLAGGFTLSDTALPPAVTGVSPVSAQNTTTALLLNLTGTWFDVGSNQWAVNLTKAGQPNITATSLTSTATTINCTFNLAGKATGDWFVNVTNADGQTGNWTSMFAITNTTPAPTVSAITPSSGLNTTSISITNLAGTGFYGTPTVNLTRAGYTNITATGVTLVSANQLTCSFDLANRMSGSWNVNVTNPDGQQAALLNGFEITNSSVPTPTPTPNPTPTSSGGGDVGPVQRQQSASSGSGMSIASGAPAGGTVTYSFGTPAPDYPVSIESISFVADQAIGQSQCLIGRTSLQEAFAIPDRPSVYETIQINWINPNVMSDAVIQFSVKGSWMREHNVGPQDIVMMRQHDLVWAELPTVYDHVENDIYYFRSTTPGFSNFAVSVRKNATITTVVNATTVTTATPPLAATATTTAVATSIPASAPVKRTSPTTAPVPAPAVQPGTGIPVLYIIAGVVIIVLGVAGFFIGRRWWWARQNPALFRKQ